MFDSTPSSAPGRRRISRFVFAFATALSLAFVGCDDGDTSNLVEEDTSVSTDDATSTTDPGDTTSTDPTDATGVDATERDGTTADVTDPDTTDPMSTIGAACETSDNCSAGEICSTLLPGGYCVQDCTTAACPSGATCAQLNDFPFCLDACTADAECRDGYACLDGVCDVGCASNADCDVNEQCSNSRCEARPADLGLGAPCTSSSRCISGYCLDPVNGGVCGEPCLSGSTCTESDWVCQEMTPLDGDVALRLCGPTPPSSLDVIDQPGNTSQFTVTVPDDAVSVHIAPVLNTVNSAGLTFSVTNGDGSVLSGEPDQFGQTAPLRVTASQGHAGLLVPINSDPNLQVQPGEWSYVVATDGNGFITDHKVYIRRIAAGEPTQARIDVNVYIPQGLDGGGVTAANAANSFEIGGAMDRMAEYWAQHDIQIGTVRYYDIGAQYRFLDANSTDYVEMFATAATGEAMAANAFMVDSLGGGAAGIAGGIPGVHPLPTNGGSGVVVELQGGPRVTGDDVTHELGHWFGLYHVTEFPAPFGQQSCNFQSGDAQCPNNGICLRYPGGQSFCSYYFQSDVISDTPECTGNPQRGFLGCMANIMYPGLLTQQQDFQSFSNNQGRVIRHTPISLLP